MTEEAEYDKEVEEDTAGVFALPGSAIPVLELPAVRMHTPTYVSTHSKHKGTHIRRESKHKVGTRVEVVQPIIGYAYMSCMSASIVLCLSKISLQYGESAAIFPKAQTHCSARSSF